MNKDILKKRKWCYLQSPSSYQVAGCDCGNENTQWSEYQEHLWCSICQKDFKPANNGIFDGPIAVNTCAMFGTYFHRVNLESGNIEALGSKGHYTPGIELSKNINNRVFDVLVRSPNDKYFLKAHLTLDKKIQIDILDSDGDGVYQLEAFIFNKAQFNSWSLKINHEKGNTFFIEDEDYESFSKYILTIKLENNIEISGKGISHKI